VVAPGLEGACSKKRSNHWPSVGPYDHPRTFVGEIICRERRVRQLLCRQRMIFMNNMPPTIHLSETIEIQVLPACRSGRRPCTVLLSWRRPGHSRQ
jgi:hypothetical protein